LPTPPRLSRACAAMGHDTSQHTPPPPLDAAEVGSLMRLEDCRRDRAGRGDGASGPSEQPTAAYLGALLGRPDGESAVGAHLVRAAQAGDAAARARLVEALLPRLVAAARRYTGWGSEFADLVQEGALALLGALVRFDPDQGTPFWAYAAPWVRGAMYRLVQDERRAVRLPPRALTDLVALKRAAGAMEGASGKEPAIAALAHEAGIGLARAEALLAADRPALSLDAPLPEEPDVVLRDLLPDPRAEAAYEDVLAGSQSAELTALLGALSSREREVLDRRLGLTGPEETLQEVGDRLGVTRERVRQVEARALAKLRQAG